MSILKLPSRMSLGTLYERYKRARDIQFSEMENVGIVIGKNFEGFAPAGKRPKTLVVCRPCHDTIHGHTTADTA